MVGAVGLPPVAGAYPAARACLAALKMVAGLDRIGAHAYVGISMGQVCPPTVCRTLVLRAVHQKQRECLTPHCKSGLMASSVRGELKLTILLLCGPRRAKWDHHDNDIIHWLTPAAHLCP